MDFISVFFSSISSSVERILSFPSEWILFFVSSSISDLEWLKEKFNDCLDCTPARSLNNSPVAAPIVLAAANPLFNCPFWLSSAISFAVVRASTTLLVVPPLCFAESSNPYDCSFVIFFCFVVKTFFPTIFVSPLEEISNPPISFSPFAVTFKSPSVVLNVEFFHFCSSFSDFWWANFNPISPSAKAEDLRSPLVPWGNFLFLYSLTTEPPADLSAPSASPSTPTPKIPALPDAVNPKEVLLTFSS